MATKHMTPAVVAAAGLLLALQLVYLAGGAGVVAAQCGREIQGKQFRDCQRFLSSQTRAALQTGLVEMVIINRGAPTAALMDCCRQLQVVTPGCQCDAIRQAARLQQERLGPAALSPDQSQKMKDKFSMITSQCGMRQQHCDPVSLYY